MSDEPNAPAVADEAEVAIAPPVETEETVEEFSQRVFEISTGLNPSGDLDSLLEGLGDDAVEQPVAEVTDPVVAQPEVPVVDAPIVSPAEPQQGIVPTPDPNAALYATIAKQSAEISRLSSATPQQPVQPTAPVGGEPVVETPVEKPVLGELPVAPVEPDLPDDIDLWSKDDVKADKAFKADLVRYTSENGAYLEGLTALVKNNSSVAEGVANDQKTSKAFQDEQNTLAEGTRKKDEFWSNLRGFQVKVPELATETDILQVHENVNEFGKKLAAISGVVNVNDESAVARVVGQYRSGDASVVSMANAAKLAKPEGFDKYFEISGLVQAKQSSDVYASVPLDEFYLIERSKSGDLQGAIDNIAATEREQTIRDMSDTVKASRENVTLPDPTLGAQPTAMEGLKFLEGLNLSEEELVLAKEVLDNPVLMSNPKYMPISNKIDSAVNRGLK